MLWTGLRQVGCNLTHRGSTDFVATDPGQPLKRRRAAAVTAAEQADLLISLPKALGNSVGIAGLLKGDRTEAPRP